MTEKKRKTKTAANKTDSKTKKTTPRKQKKAAEIQQPETESNLDAQGEFPIVGIGASAGGLEAFEEFFKNMPPDSGIAFVLVAHLASYHVSILPELIQRQTRMKVLSAGDGRKVRPDAVYIIPPNKDLAILHGTLQLLEQRRNRGPSMPIDSFFRSLAQDQGANAIGILLSGTGTDGTLGLRAIKGEGGMIMVQDEESARYTDMPRGAIATNLADFVLPPAMMPAQLLKYVHHKAVKPHLKVSDTDNETANTLQKIFILLRSRTGHDFSLYKQNTVCRRIERRMHVQQIDNVSDYVRYLQKNKKEADILFKELLINVTNFFRDPEAFAVLEEKVLPELLVNKKDGSDLRIWVPGCSSGEEAYSIGITLQECMARLNRTFNVQIFGTDIDAEAIATARAGLYPASIAKDVGEERLKRYFTKEDNLYRIKKIIREMVVFAPQNIIKDPPFTRLDLLCCRNLLIYLDPEPQKKILPVFHYALKPEGILFLGSSETVGPSTDLFAVLNRKRKIFRRKPTSLAARPILEFPHESSRDSLPAKEGVPAGIMEAEELSPARLLEITLQQSDNPPCAIIDEASNILYIHGRIGRFLEPAEGKFSANILEMARSDLKINLAAAIRNVSRTRQVTVHNSLEIRTSGGALRADLLVKPVLIPGLPNLMMVIFKEKGEETGTEKEGPTPPALGKKSREVELLEQELQYTKEDLRTTIEELETSNEELKATNEELQSTNEELQSTNEELETSKEEQHSLNEEAATLNLELQSRIDDLVDANNDLKNLLDSTQIATIFLDMELNVRRFTPKAKEIIPLTSIDMGRPLKHFASRLNNVDLCSYAEQVLKDLDVNEEEVSSKNGAWYRMRQRLYRTSNNMIDGVIITFEDITKIKENERTIQEARVFAESIVDTVRTPLIVLDQKMKVVSANRSFYQTFKTRKEETVGRLIYELGNRQWDIPGFRELLEKILPKDSEVMDYKVEHDFPFIGHRTMMANAKKLHGKAAKKPMILLAIEDVTDKLE